MSLLIIVAMIMIILMLITLAMILIIISIIVLKLLILKNMVNHLLSIFASFCCLLKTETKCAGCLLLKLTPLISQKVYHDDNDDGDGDDDDDWDHYDDDGDDDDVDEYAEENLYSRVRV